MKKTATFTISSNEKKAIDALFEKIEEPKKEAKFRVVSFENLFKLLDKQERAIIERIVQVNPLAYGFKGKYYGVGDVPNDLVEVVHQKYIIDKKTKAIETQFLPKAAFDAYTALNKALYKDEKKHVLVLSGYRSPAYQVIVFLWYLRDYRYDFPKTIKRAAIPGYSEHGFAEKQAIDFMTEEGSPTDEDPFAFEKTFEYKWLVKNAKKYHFYETNPKNNTIGTMFEPWHWAYIKKD